MQKIFELNILALTLFLCFLLGFSLSSYIIINISFFVFLFFCFFVLKNEKFFSPKSLIFFTAVPYFMAGFFDYIFFDNSKNFNYRYLLEIFFYSGLFFISFYFVAYTSKKMRINYEVFPKKNNKFIICFYMIFIFLYCILVQYFIGYNIGSISRADIYANKSLILDLYKTSLYIYSVLVGWSILSLNNFNKKYLNIFLTLLLVFLFTEIFVLGDRKQSIILIMCILSLFSLKGFLKLKHYLVFFISLILFFLYGAVRNRPLERWGELLGNTDLLAFINPANMEFGAFTIIWHDIYNRYNGHAYFDLTYMYVIDQLIPSFINPNREIAPSVKFIRDFYPDIYEQGGGMAFNAILESILNFSILGPILLGVFVGYLSKFTNTKTQIGVLITLFFIYNTSFFFRVDMVSIIRSSIIFIVITLCYLFVFCSIKKTRS